MPWLSYDSHRTRQYNGNALNFPSATVKLMILKATYTPNRATHAFKADVDAHEVSGGNYTAGGLTLAGKTLTIVANRLKIDCDDLVVAQHAAGFADGRHGVLYVDTGVASTSPLWGLYDFGADRGNVNGDLNLKTPNGLWLF